MDRPSPPRLSPFECLAPELLSKVALFVALADDNQLGPPSCILPLTRTSRSLRRAISLSNNTHLLAGLFRARFDDAAFARRIRMKVSTTALASEYLKRCETLQRIRAGNIDGTTLVEDLWTVYLMLLEHDQRNVGQLIIWANLHRYLLKFLCFLAPDIRHVLDIPSKDTTALSLGIYLLCYISNADILCEETSGDRKVLIDTLEALVLCGFRLPSFYGPDSNFRVQDLQVRQSSHSRVGGFDAQRFPVPKISSVTHFGFEINLRPPPISTSAFLALVARYEFAQEEKGPLLFEASVPVDRAAANTLGVTGPTQADMTEIVSRTRNKLLGMRPRGTDRFGRGTSKDYDEEWHQVTSCFYPETSGLRSSLKLPQGRAFVPGQLSGLWAGKFMVPERLSYRKLISRAPQSPVENVCMYQQPMYMRLREHHYLDNGSIASSISDPDPDPNSLLRAWFPKDSVLAEDREGAHLDVYCPTSQTRSRYETYFPAQDGSGTYPGCVASKSKQKNSSRRPYFACSPRCIPNECLACEGNVAQPSGVADILITGETDNDHAQAWGQFSFTGRVRLWDGLIALLRRPTNPEDSGLGTWIFRGYISAPGLLIGRWRETATGMEVPGWEGPFVLTKQTEKLEVEIPE